MQCAPALHCSARLALLCGLGTDYLKVALQYQCWRGLVSLKAPKQVLLGFVCTSAGVDVCPALHDRMVVLCGPPTLQLHVALHCCWCSCAPCIARHPKSSTGGVVWA